MAVSVHHGATVVPSRATTAPRAGVSARLGIVAEALVVLGLVAVGGLVRWPNLLLSPQFSSVGETAMRALDVVDGRALYLTDSAPYLGAPFLYVLALVYRLFGPSVEATVLVAWTIGTLTIVPTYLLGREVGGRVAGIVGAAFLATSGAHTVITSHVPLSHSLTPLAATVTLWLLARAIRQSARRSTVDPDPGNLGTGDSAVASAPGAWSKERGAAFGSGGRMLALAGLGAGLSLQTHPTVLPLLAGSALGAVAMRPGWLRTRWPVVAAACLVLGYGTLLAHHVVSRFDVVADIEGKQARYLDDDDDSVESSERGVYAKNLELLGLSAVRMSSGAILDRETTRDYLADGWVLAYPILAVAGLAVAARRGAAWLAAGAACMVLLPPILNGKYGPILDGRYLMPLMPVIFVGIGLAFAALVRLVEWPTTSAHAPSDPGRPRSSPAARFGRSAALVGLAVAALVLVARPVTLLGEFYEESQEDGFSNALYLRTLDQVKAARTGDEGVILDERLQEVKSHGGGKAGTNFTWLLAVSRIPTEPLASVTDPAALDGRLAILQRATAERLAGQLTLTSIDGRRAGNRDPQSYRAYRIALKP